MNMGDGERGEAEQVFPYESYRKGQLEVSSHVKETVEKGEILLLEAPTGFGKTAAVIDGLLRAGADKVLWTVRTVNQIDPVLRELRRFGASYTFIYSARRSCPLLQGEDIPVEDFWLNCRHLRSRGRCSFYTNALDAGQDYIQGLLGEYREYTATETADLLARIEGLCPFFALLKLAGTARFVVATYPYLFKWDLFTHVLDIGGYSDLVIVVDEAHSLLGIHSIYEYSITIDVIEKSIGELETYTGEEDLKTRLETLYAGMRRIVEQRRQPGLYAVDKTPVKELLGDPDQLAYIAETVREVMIEERLRSHGPAGVMRIATGLTKLATWAAVVSMESSRLYLEVDEEGDHRLIATPMDPAEIAAPVIEEAQSAVLMSGTLPPGNMVADFLGVTRPAKTVDVELMYGPVMPPRNKYTVIALDVSTRYSERGKRTYDLYSSYIMDIHDALPGVKLAVYPSYDVMYSIVSRLGDPSGMVVERRKTTLSEVLRRLYTGDEILIHAVAGGKLVEGVEYVDSNGRSMLSTVIVVGIPYPQPNPYTRDYIESLSKRIGSKKAREYAYQIQASIKVRQAMGRAIRSREDKAVIFLLDHRYNTRKMRSLLKTRIDEVTTYNKITFPPILEKAKKHLQNQP